MDDKATEFSLSEDIHNMGVDRSDSCTNVGKTVAITMFASRVSESLQQIRRSETNVYNRMSYRSGFNDFSHSKSPPADINVEMAIV